ncbi:helix-turn-helix domain-containing protein [Albibacterium bauzanense]|nr:helix-turn-helix transcriptional regulator [Albibacterium bauzanense]
MNLLVFAILFSGVLQGVLLAYLLFKKKPEQLSNKLLAFLIVILVFHLSLIAIDVKDLFIRFPHLSRLSWVIPLSYGPLILLLTQCIVTINFTLQKKHLIYFLPLIIYGIALTPYFTLPAYEKVEFLKDPIQVSNADFGIYNSLTGFIHIGFVLFSLWVFYTCKKKLPTYFSNPSRVYIKWLEQFLWAILIIMIFSIIAFFAKKHNASFLSAIYPYNFLLVVPLIYWIAYKLLLSHSNYKNPRTSISNTINTTNLPSEDIGKKYSKTALSLKEVEKIKLKLKEYMAKEKPYLNPDLSIDDLSAQLIVKRHHLSQAINISFNKNFFEFINGYRIEEFKKQAKDLDNDHLSILGIALNCGFNSKATFNSVFKKQEGITPSTYIKEQET